MVNSSNIIPPPSLSEIILKTSNFDVMKDWYKIALDMEPFFTRGRPEEVSWTKSQQIVFFKLYGLYPHAQMFGIFEVDGTEKKVGIDPGLHHFQLAHSNFEELFNRYECLKKNGIVPIQRWNHGVMTSFYYEDPDGNQPEMTCMNFEREEDFRAYFETEAYKNNISGVSIDPEEYIARYRSGTPQKDLIKIPV